MVECPYRSISFIINPAAGRVRVAHIAGRIERFFAGTGCDVSIQTTEFPEHAKWLVTEELDKGAEIIVAVGGDGTVNEVGSVIAGSGVPLGIIPMGSGNGLARHLKIPRNFNGALRTICRKKTLPIDVGSVNGHLFFCTSGLGFDAMVGHAFEKSGSRKLYSYAKSFLRNILKYKPEQYEISVDGNVFREKAFILTLANASQYGSGAYISPEAEIDDGCLDVCIVRDFPRIVFIPLVISSFLKRINRSPRILIIRGRDIAIRVPGQGSVRIHYDGEPGFARTPVYYRIVDQKLSVLC